MTLKNRGNQSNRGTMFLAISLMHWLCIIHPDLMLAWNGQSSIACEADTARGSATMTHSGEPLTPRTGGGGAMRSKMSGKFHTAD